MAWYDDPPHGYGTENATHDGCHPRDQLERPVLVKASGIKGYVVGCNGPTIFVAARGHEPAMIDLDEAIPLCVDCLMPLAPSESESPGECHNAICFLQRDPTPGCRCWHCRMAAEE